MRSWGVLVRRVSNAGPDHRPHLHIHARLQISFDVPVDLELYKWRRDSDSSAWTDDCYCLRRETTRFLSMSPIIIPGKRDRLRSQRAYDVETSISRLCATLFSCGELSLRRNNAFPLQTHRARPPVHFPREKESG